MHKFLTTIVLAGLLAASVQAKLPSEQWLLGDQPMDVTVNGLADKAAEAAAKPREWGTAARFAVKGAAERDLLQGKWEELPDGRMLKRIRIHSAGAVNLNLALSPFFLPHGAELYFYDDNRQTVWGPWTDEKNRNDRQFWTPVVPGETAWLELVVPRAMQAHVELGLKSVQHGFIDPADALLKSGSCNVDVACPEADPWRDEVKSASMYTRGGQDICSGTLINNAREDGKLLFLTANHCGLDSSNTSSLVFYWEYESPTCRAVDSSANGIAVNRNQYTVATTLGATFLASNPLSDFALIELDEDPAPNAEVYWAGWDRTDRNNAGPVTVIHHPNLDEKRISFENDDVLAGPSYSQYTQGDPNGFWKVTDWDLGTTEGGSSGSGLWNANHHLIGQLLGGAAACGNDSPDWFGRLATSWDTGTTASTRLKDWLDPDNSGAMTLDGKAECNQPDVSISSSNNPARVGESVVFRVTASGGAGGYNYAWDVNGDGITDYVGGDFETVYSQGYSGNVSVTVTDSAGCSRRASLAQVVQQPAFSVSGLAPTEVCGDGDSVMEPGEQWDVPVTLVNSNSLSADNVVAVLTRTDALNKAGSKALGGPDDFGYTYRDSDELFCPYAELDISSTGLDFSPTASGSYPANDDGGALINLETPDFRLYGDSITQLVMSTNGYLSTNPQASGGDFSADCPLPALPSADLNGHRLAPLHDDLVVDRLYYQHFDNCPRPGDVDGATGCHVFQWEGTGVWVNASTTEGDFRVQAFLYDGSDEIVYQYSNGVAVGSSPTIGLQNKAANSGLTYSCGNANPVQDNTAVCFYAPGKTPGGGAADSIILQTPVLNFGDIAADGQANTMASIYLVPEMSCGAIFGLDVEGVAFDGGYDPDASYRIFGGQAGGDTGVCDLPQPCPILDYDVTPKNGLWNNSNRPGHGLDLFFINGSSVFTAWYTARSDHSPIWYTMTGGLNYGQVQAKLYSLGWDTVNNRLDDTRTVAVGSMTLNFLDAETAWMTWEVNGKHGMEPIAVYNDALQTPAVNYSGMWYNPQESGWGISFNNKGETNFSLIYFYDENGNPSWVLGTNQNDDGGQVDLLHVQAICPDCPGTPLNFKNAGSINLNFSSQTEGTVDTSISVDDRDYDVNWQRSNLPFYMISEPE